MSGKTGDKITELNRAFSRAHKSFEVSVEEPGSPLSQLTRTEEELAGLIRNLVNTYRGVKFYVTLGVEFGRSADGGTTYRTAYPGSRPVVVLHVEGLNSVSEKLGEVNAHIMGFIDAWIDVGSGWWVSRVKSHYVKKWQ